MDVFVLCTLPFALAFVLIVWFETDVLIEYIQLFRLQNMHESFKNFLANREAGSPINYKEYLAIYYDSFFVRLITCPICLSTWLALISGMIAALVIDWRIVLIAVLPMAYLSLFLFGVMEKIIKR